MYIYKYSLQLQGFTLVQAQFSFKVPTKIVSAGFVSIFTCSENVGVSFLRSSSPPQICPQAFGRSVPAVTRLKKCRTRVFMRTFQSEFRTIHGADGSAGSSKLSHVQTEPPSRRRSGPQPPASWWKTEALQRRTHEGRCEEHFKDLLEDSASPQFTFHEFLKDLLRFKDSFNWCQPFKLNAFMKQQASVMTPEQILEDKRHKALKPRTWLLF